MSWVNYAMLEQLASRQGVLLGADGYCYMPVMSPLALTQVGITSSGVYLDGPIYSVVKIGDYLYTGGQTNQTVSKLKASDLSLVASVSAVGYRLAAVGGYVYCIGATTNKLIKLDANTLQKVAESAETNTLANAPPVIDGDYIYVAAKSALLKYRLDTLELVATSSGGYFGGTIKTIAALGDYVYFGGTLDASNPQTIRKLNKSDLVQVLESPSYITDATRLKAANGYLYAQLGSLLNKLDPTNLTPTVSSVSFSATDMVITDESIFSVSGTKMRENSSVDLTSIDYDLFTLAGESISMHLSDGTFYVGMQNAVQKIHSLSQIVGYRRLEK